MLETLIKQRRWQALIQFLHRTKQPGIGKFRTFLASKLGRKKPSLIVSIGRRRKANLLEEYRRIFEPRVDRQPEAPGFMSPSDRGVLDQPAQLGTKRAAQPGRERPSPVKAKKSGRRRPSPSTMANRSRSGTSYGFDGAIWARLLLALLRGYHGLAGIKFGRNQVLAVMLVCAIGLGGAYLYRTMKGPGEGSLPVEEAQGPSGQDSGRSPAGKKFSYDRLAPDDSATGTAPADAAALREAPMQAPMPGSDSPGGGTRAAETPAPALPASGRQDIERPTAVRSETYLPDGSRADPEQPAAIPADDKLDSGAVRPSHPAVAEPANASAEATPQPVRVQDIASPAAAPSSESDYFVQVKSDQDLKAAEDELAAIAEKYKPVLGEVPLVTRSVDLKAKGVWIRVLAGPLKSREDAANLCGKLKSAGLAACLVNKAE